MEPVVAVNRSNHASFAGRAKAFSRASIDAAELRFVNQAIAASDTGGFARVNAAPLPDR